MATGLVSPVQGKCQLYAHLAKPELRVVDTLVPVELPSASDFD